MDDSPPEWPRDLLDMDALRGTGWTPQPFQQFVLKVHSRCNLACTYCYVYRSADQTWKIRPARMSRKTVVQTVERIAEHVQAHELRRIQIVLHGGEPLLAGSDLIAFLSSSAREAMVETKVDVQVHTNGTLLDEATLRVLHEYGVRVGVSFDGDPATHDAHRIHRNGRGSYAEVAQGLKLLRRPDHRHLFAGFLCVIDPRSDPVTTYERLLEHEPPTVDFLLPHANWSRPPARPSGSSSTPYGDWLVTVFDRWYSAPQRETSVRLFHEMMRGVLGRPTRLETIGLAPARLVVVETDGSIEQTDALKSAYEGAADTGLHVRRDPFDAALSLPQVAARQIGELALDDTCRQCDIRSVCGGGFYPHRYEQGSGFRNRSVYCRDLERLIRHVHARMVDDLAPVREPLPG